MSESPNTESSGSVGRREFLGSAALTGAGVALGLSAYFTDSKDKGPPLAEFNKSPDNQVRIGFIGVGNRGSSLLRTALQVPGAIPMAVADVQAIKRKEMGDQIRQQMVTKLEDDDFKVQLEDDYRRLLDNKDVEAVVIATPHYLHGPMAIDAIEAGKHVYCEKAMAFTIGENQDIYDLIRHGDPRTPGGDELVFQVGHQRHYSPLYRRVQQMAADDYIGDITAMRGQWNSNDQIRRPAADPALEKVVNWRLYSELSGGLTTEFATHQIDVANWILGTHPDSVCGFGGVDWYTGDGRDTHDNIHLVFNYKVPIKARDAYGRVKKVGRDVVYELDAAGQVKTRNVKFQYTSIMTNEHLKASELVMGRYGTIGVSLGGGEFFKEKKARQDPARIAEGTNPARAKQKDILQSGSTVDPTQTSLSKKSGDPISGDIYDPQGGDPSLKYHWSKYIKPIQGAYDQVETLLAIESFCQCIAHSRKKEPFAHKLGANVEVGMWSAVPALMANIAMREERTVYWNEFFPAT